MWRADNYQGEAQRRLPGIHESGLCCQLCGVEGHAARSCPDLKRMNPSSSARGEPRDMASDFHKRLDLHESERDRRGGAPPDNRGASASYADAPYGSRVPRGIPPGHYGDGRAAYGSAYDYRVPPAQDYVREYAYGPPGRPAYRDELDRYRMAIAVPRGPGYYQPGYDWQSDPRYQNAPRGAAYAHHLQPPTHPERERERERERLSKIDDNRDFERDRDRERERTRRPENDEERNRDRPRNYDRPREQSRERFESREATRDPDGRATVSSNLGSARDAPQWGNTKQTRLTEEPRKRNLAEEAAKRVLPQEAEKRNLPEEAGKRTLPEEADKRNTNGETKPGPKMTYVADEPFRHNADAAYAFRVERGTNFARYEDVPVNMSGRGSDALRPLARFNDCSMPKALLDNLQMAGYDRPTPIQKYAMPILLGGRDIMGLAQSGSGKTAAYLIPLIARLLTDWQSMVKSAARGAPLVLIVTPTRELAKQVLVEAYKLVRATELQVEAVYGGTHVATDYQRFRERPVHVLIATAGRLRMYVDPNLTSSEGITRQPLISLGHLKAFVLDEADRLLEDCNNQVDHLHSILNHLPTERQTVMLTATMPESVAKLASSHLHDYIRVQTGLANSACGDVEQRFIELRTGETKNDELLALLGGDAAAAHKTLIFVDQRKRADFLCMWLGSHAFASTSIHGDRVQADRERALTEFRDGRARLLVATDVAARGIDIPHVDLVVNYDLPNDITEYIHRIGRTGRMGNVGKAVSFYDHSVNSSMAPALVRTLREVNQPVPDWLDRYARADFFSENDEPTGADIEDDLLGGGTVRGNAAKRDNPSASRAFANAAVAHDKSELWD